MSMATLTLKALIVLTCGSGPIPSVLVKSPIEEEITRPTFTFRMRPRGLCMSRGRGTCFVSHHFIVISNDYLKGKQSKADKHSLVMKRSNVYLCMGDLYPPNIQLLTIPLICI